VATIAPDPVKERRLVDQYPASTATHYGIESVARTIENEVAQPA